MLDLDGEQLVAHNSVATLPISVGSLWKTSSSHGPCWRFVSWNYVQKLHIFKPDPLCFLDVSCDGKGPHIQALVSVRVLRGDLAIHLAILDLCYATNQVSVLRRSCTFLKSFLDHYDSACTLFPTTGFREFTLGFIHCKRVRSVTKKGA